MNEKWDQRFLALAKFVSTWSKDPSTQVGAVVTDKKQIVSLGFNGFPPGMSDDSKRLNDRKYKYEHIVHAEINALNFSARVFNDGCTLYTYPFMPCFECAERIVEENIKRVISVHSDNPRWVESFKKSKKIFSNAKIELVLYEKLIQLV